MTSTAKHVLLTLVAAYGLTLIAWRGRTQNPGPTNFLGLCLLGVGFVLWTVARFQLGSSFTVSAEARHLVTKGLYARLRNPIYVFGSIMLVELILWTGRPIWLLIFVPIIPLQIRRAHKEAQVLETHFGEEYRRYRASTWI